MQFRASSPPPLASASVALRRFDDVARGGALSTTASAGRGGSCSPKKPPHVQHTPAVQPGTLLSINQSTSQRKVPVAAASTAPSAAKPPSTKKRAAAPTTSPEPIDYLQLRRTEQSKQALLRNRQIVHEILSPAPAPPQVHQPQTRASNASLQLLSPPGATTTVANAQAVLDDLARSCRDKGQVDSAVLAAGMQQLCREQRRVEAQSQVAASQLQVLLTDIRQNVSLQRSFAPLFRIYSHHKLASRWRAWRSFVSWHRLEQQRLESLAPHALQIQRVFRRKRTKWTRARERLALAWAQWQAALVLQRWSRRCLRSQTQHRARETLYAARLQAAWRGRQTRRQVKKALQDRLRWMLAALTPTGNLHRLHEVLARSPPEFVAQVNHALSLVAETHVALNVSGNAQHKPRSSAIAARHFAQPVDATRKQLFHAVHELHALVRQRTHDIAAAKHASVENARTKHLESEQRDAALKREKLAAVHDRLAEEAARVSMEKAELETREHLRVLRTAASDALLRQLLRETRREQAERSLMLVEEYSARYLVAETRRRAFESKLRLQEVTKREQFLHDQEQRELAELLAVLKHDELKRLEAQQKQAHTRAAEQQKWAHLSRDEKAHALQRLELREQQRLDEHQALETRKREEQEAALEVTRQKDALRAQRQQEIARELAERAALALEEKQSRRWHFEERKRSHASHWEAKREREKLRYSIDPMHFARVQAQRQQEERERRERSLMTQSDALSAAVREKERKEQYFRLCRDRRRQRLIDGAAERAESALMHAEEELVVARLEAARKADEFRAQLQRMQELALRDKTREHDRILEAKRRKEMHDEELRQRRLQQAQALADGVREKRERQAMEAQERAQRHVDAACAKLDERRQRARLNLRMMKEDVASMERQDWEDEGARLEQLLWTPHDAAAFAHLVRHHSAFLRANVEVLQELVGRLRDSSPPFELDFDAVHAHLAHETELPIDHVPPRPRKPRKFFYHEFFEDDPILSRVLKPPAPTEDELRAQAVSSKARERWKMLGRHFFGHMWSCEAARRGYVQMHNQQYAAAFGSLHEAVVGCQRASPAKPAPTALVRQLARCCLKLWEASAQRSWLNKSLFFLQQAGAHVLQLTSPSFLQEIAFVLEQAGSYRLSAEILGGIIQCFPRYTRLAQVIFRGAVVMIALRMFRQAREYLLHVLDAQPFGCWEPFEIQFLVARVLQLEGKLQRRLCEVAYEDAFKRNKRDAFFHLHATWQDWIKAADTWRRFGDACFAKREFVLAKDAYQLMLKRQLDKPAHLVSKRQQVRLQVAGSSSSSHARRDHANEIETEAKGADDWLRLARVCAALNDRSKTELALHRWFERKSYRARVLEQFCAWPLVRWKLLGLEVPEHIVRMRDAKEKAQREAEAKLRREIDEQRQEVLKRRSSKARTVMTAWQQEDDDAPSSAVFDMTAPGEAGKLEEPWDGTTDTGTSAAPYWDEGADEVSLEPPG